MIVGESQDGEPPRFTPYIAYRVFAINGLAVNILDQRTAPTLT